jgi:hypothetical protein
MKNRMLKIIIVNLMAIFGIGMPSYSSDLRLVIVASSFEKSGLNQLKVDYKIDSNKNVILMPFSYGWIPTPGWIAAALAFEPHNTLHFCVDENGVTYPNDLIYSGAKKAPESLIYSDPRIDNSKYFYMAARNHGSDNDRNPMKLKTNKRYFRFCLVNVKNEGYVVSNLFSFNLNSDYEICEAKNITWSEMPEIAQKSMEALIITKAKNLKEHFTDEMIKNQINQWK